MFPEFEEFSCCLEQNADEIFDAPDLRVYQMNDFTPENAQQLYAATVNDIASFSTANTLNLLRAYHAFLAEHLQEFSERQD